MRIIVDGLPYPIVVTDEAPKEAAFIAAREAARSIVVCDRSVESRAHEVVQSLQAAGCHVLGELCIDAGERRKQWKSVHALHTAFLEAGVDRTSLVIGIGGGTLTDVVGFAAATFMRGVRWLALPTTVLGMVDAAIGGKTGVDRPEGKNLIGAIWQPVGVVADLESLATLPAVQRRTGMAEVIKAAIVGDAALLDAAEQADVDAAPQRWASLIAQAAAVKARVVAIDLNDSGTRATLNLGHTFAHAIEHASKYRVAHGAAVALGLRAAGVLARTHTGWSHDDHRRVVRVLRRAGLRVRSPKISADAIIAAMQSDKKRIGGVLQFVLPVRLGEVRAGVEVPEADVRQALSALQSLPVRGAW
ncbi:MAG: 3-dehydroquinate synthase [Candidatus Eremiobacteraeota bacterium]|nr:3-dehydroquinate synthase [Candidatus Eremiobacteraeota bacterium]